MLAAQDCLILPWGPLLFFLGATALFGFSARWILRKLKGIRMTPPWAVALAEIAFPTNTILLEESNGRR